MTALAGLPVYLDLASVMDLGDGIGKHLHVKIQGWTDEQIITSLILLNLAGVIAWTTFASSKPMRGFAGYSVASNLRGFHEGSDAKRRGGGAPPLLRHPGSALTTPPPRYGEPSFSDHHLR